MAGGAYLSAKNGAKLLASKHFCRSAGVVMSIEGGPSRPDEQIHTSRRPWVGGQFLLGCSRGKGGAWVVGGVVG